MDFVGDRRERGTPKTEIHPAIDNEIVVQERQNKQVLFLDLPEDDEMQEQDGDNLEEPDPLA